MNDTAPDFAQEQPTLQQLKEVLGYSLQHANAISLIGYKALPDIWPKPPLTEVQFLQGLLDTLNDPGALPVFIDHPGWAGRKGNGRGRNHEDLKPFTRFCIRAQEVAEACPDKVSADRLIDEVLAKGAPQHAEIILGYTQYPETHDFLRNFLTASAQAHGSSYRIVGSWLVFCYQAAFGHAFGPQSGDPEPSPNHPPDPEDVLVGSFADVLRDPWEREPVDRAIEALRVHQELIDALGECWKRTISVIARIDAAPKVLLGESASEVNSALRLFEDEGFVLDANREALFAAVDDLDAALDTLHSAASALTEAERLLGERIAEGADFDALEEATDLRKAAKAAISEARNVFLVNLRQFTAASSCDDAAESPRHGTELEDRRATADIPPAPQPPPETVAGPSQEDSEAPRAADPEPPPAQGEPESTPDSDTVATHMSATDSAAVPEPTPEPQRDAPADAAPCDLSSHVDPLATPNAVWALVAEGDTARAYHLARSMAARHAEPLDGCGPSCLLALALAPELGAVTDTVTEPLGAALSQALTSEPASRAEALLLLAATLRPALIAPYVMPARAVLAQLLDSKRIDHEALRDVASAVMDASRISVAISEASLKGETLEASHARALAQAKRAAGTFLHQMQTKTIKYAAATRVWRQWVDTGDPARMLRAACDDDRRLLEEARAFVELWSDRKKLGPILDATDEDIRKVQARRRPIEGAAREDLFQLAAEATQHVQAWIELVDGHASHADADGHSGLGAWATRTASLVDKALDALTRQQGFDLQEQAGLSAVHAALRDLRALIDPEVAVPARLRWQEVLGRPLALIPALELDRDWVPVTGYGEPWFEDALRATPPTLEAAWQQAMADCLHEVSARLLRLMPFVGLGEDVSRRERERAGDLGRCRATLTDSRQRVAHEVAHALDFGWIDEATRTGLIERIEALDVRFGDDIGRAFRDLDAVSRELDEHKHARVQEERERLREHPALIDNDPLRARIEAMLDRGDIVTAAEFVWHAESGTEPPTDDHWPRLQDAFFPGFVEASERACADAPWSQLRAEVGEGRWPSGLEPVPEDLGAAFRLLDAYARTCRYAAYTEAEDLSAVASACAALGFEEARVTALAGASPSAPALRLNARPIKDRDLCPVPQYGSLAFGTYRLVCVGARVQPVNLVRTILEGEPLMPGAPTLVLYDGRLSVVQRRELARQCRAKDARFLLLDAWLVLYLASVAPAQRLKALFECTLPFTPANPYASTAAVPQEMFFGRRQAIRSLVDPGGTHSVYGGRQLGKSALLHEVVRRYHAPDTGFIALYVDLDDAGLGISRPIDSLWSLIAGLLPAQIAGEQISRYETLEKRLLGWLEADPQRRLLLLLDESDRLMAQDAAMDYAMLRALKGLMDRSQRRIKVVLAGLHNMQRASRDPNSPLAHLGTPLCIGPLIDEGESREAFRLITQPLRALGYRIDDEVVHRILGYAAYAPNLIQDFCKRLLDYLNPSDHPRFDPDHSPPYRITSEMVENAYQLKGLRGFVQDRFRITLDLDPRYRLLALMIAHETLSRRHSPAPGASAFDVAWIRDQALTAWARGFPDASAEGFRVLLDEMVGLGVLRVSDGRYGLRSPNLVNLLGSHGTIAQDLRDAAAKEPPAPYTAAIHRRRLGDRRTSPFTAEQEHLLLAAKTGVSLAFGLAEAGIGEALEALAQAAAQMPESRVLRCEAADASGLFADSGAHALVPAMKAQFEGSHLLILVATTCAWTPQDVAGIAQVLQTRRRRNRSTARVVFLGGADKALAWRQEVAGPLFTPMRTADLQAAWSAIKNQKPPVVSLKPWAREMLARRMQEHALVLDESRSARIEAATGLWHGPLHALLDGLGSNPDHWGAAIDTLEGPSPDRDALRAQLCPDALADEVFGTMASWDGPITVAELSELLAVDAEVIEPLLDWGDLAGFVRAQAGGAWLLDPYVQAALR